jgi:hypothetical protein
MDPKPKSFLDLPFEDDLNVDAALAKGAYDYIPIVKGWTRDEELSNFNRSVYTKGGKAKIAYRGTDLHRENTWLDDLGTDILIAVGLQDKGSRFHNAKKTADLAIEKYGRENVSLTGHSLGGSQSSWVSRKTGLKGTGFNTGWGPADALRKRTYSEFTNVTASGDIISAMGSANTTMKHVNIKPTSNPHNLRNFIDYEFPVPDTVMSSKYSYTPREWTHQQPSNVFTYA